MSLFSEHPAGASGIALLLLRSAAALVLCGVGLWLAALYIWAAAALAVLAIFLLVGFGTRIAALISAVVVVGVGFEIGGWQGALIGIWAMNFAAIALLGAGAYSVDAALFGRRVIWSDS